MTDTTTDTLDEQPAPATTCPHCGGDPAHDPQHLLSAVGYLPDDIAYECSACEETWVHGVPIGENNSELAEALFCNACEERYAKVHRVEWRWDDQGPRACVFHLKCPNCYHFFTSKRVMEDGQRTVLVGHPDITGSIEDAEKSHAYNEDEV
jgi:hypothetical protein